MPSFPYKLHQLLTDVEGSEEYSNIISWLPTGNGFRLHNPVLFEQLILPKYFPRQKKVLSFKRQVQYYCFENLGNGSYVHKHFIRGHKSRCGKMMHKFPKKRRKVFVARNGKKICKSNPRSWILSIKVCSTVDEKLPAINHLKKHSTTAKWAVSPNENGTSRREKELDPHNIRKLVPKRRKEQVPLQDKELPLVQRNAMESESRMITTSDLSLKEKTSVDFQDHTLIVDSDGIWV